MLEIQKYLRAGKSPENLKEELGIRHDSRDGLVLFSYDQIESPKTHPVVLDARGIVLEEKTWDVVCLSFRRFFNHGEALELTRDFPVEGAVAQEKIDGSLVQQFRHGGRWRMSTRGKIDGTGNVALTLDNMTFGDLFRETRDQYGCFNAGLDAKYSYTFELVSPENRVVTPYKERALYLTLMRNCGTLEEQPPEVLDATAARLGFRRPKTVSFTDIAELIGMAAGLPSSFDEGFVCVNYSKRLPSGDYPRIKIKNPAYVAIAHLKESSGKSATALMELIMFGDPSDFLAAFPEYQKFVDPIAEKFRARCLRMREEADWAAPYLALERTPANRKAFAELAKKAPDPSYLFSMLDGRAGGTYLEYLRKQAADKTPKGVARTMLERLGIKNREAE